MRKGLINVNKLQRILCMVLSAILLMTWMPSLAEDAAPAPEAEPAPGRPAEFEDDLPPDDL